ncbi:hypothetical protein H0H92_006446, partial [Tricholoma furcatifolium]
MFFRLSTAVALSVVALFCGKAAADIVCPVCPASIVYADETRTLTGILYTASEGVVQCDYEDPRITDFNPYCLYYVCEIEIPYISARIEHLTEKRRVVDHQHGRLVPQHLLYGNSDDFNLRVHPLNLI